MHESVNQAMVIRVGALGDLLVTTPALVETLELFPEASLWVMGTAPWLDLIDPAQWPRITGLIIIEKRARAGQLYTCENGRWQPKDTPRPLSEFFRQCQATVDLRVESLRFAWGPWRNRVAIRKGICPWPLKWLYTHWSPWLGMAPVIHERDRMLRIVEAPVRRLFPLGTRNANRQQLLAEQGGADRYAVFQQGQNPKTLAFKWRDRALPRLREADPNAAHQLTRCNDYWLLNPTASDRLKAWPADKFCLLAASLAKELAQHKHELFIIGAPTESAWLKEVAGPIAILQPENLEALFAIVAGARGLITNTSSVQFIAATAGVPVFTFMGRTWPARWGPLGRSDEFITGEIPRDFRGGIHEEDQAGYDSISVEKAWPRVKAFANRVIG